MTEKMISVLLLVVALLDSAKGLEHRIVRDGTDILLDVNVTTALSSDAVFFWKHHENNKDINVVKFIFGQKPKISSDKYRAEFFNQNYSLLLKNVQQNYSGLYKAVLNTDEDHILVVYNITVQEPVSPVRLTVTKSNSSECNLTVTCRTEDSNLSRTFLCNKTSCLPQEGAPISLSVYLQQDHIICNHSNQVSWIKDTKDIKAYCEKEKGPSTVSSTTIITSSVLTVVVLVAAALLVKWLTGRKGQEHTVLPQSMNQSENPYDNSEEVTSQSPSTTYALVQFVPRPGQQSEPLTTAHPETVYAQVNRATKVKSTDPTAEDQRDDFTQR